MIQIDTTHRKSRFLKSRINPQGFPSLNWMTFSKARSLEAAKLLLDFGASLRQGVTSATVVSVKKWMGYPKLAMHIWNPLVIPLVLKFLGKLATILVSPQSCCSARDHRGCTPAHAIPLVVPWLLKIF